MDLSDDEKIKIHLENVEKFKTEQHKNVLSLQDLKELNLNIGLSELEWSELMEKASHHLTLAKNHLNGNNYTDAFDNADKALALNPFIKGGKTTKAKAALHLWLLDDNEDYKNEAEALAKNVLQENSTNKDALAILKQIRTTSRTLSKTHFSLAKLKGSKWIIIVFLVSLFFMGLFILNTSSSSTIVSPIKTEQVYNQLSLLEENVQSVLADLKNAYSRKNNLIEEIASTQQNLSSDIKDDLQKLKENQRSADNITEWYSYQLQIDELLKAMKQQTSNELSEENTALLWIQIEGAENRITFARRKYNDAIRQYNLYAKQNSTNNNTIKLMDYLND